jgi:hypothetical protein
VLGIAAMVGLKVDLTQQSQKRRDKLSLGNETNSNRRIEMTKSIAEIYPKITAKPGPGVFVCKKCGLVNHSKNPWFRSSFIADDLVGSIGSMMLLTTEDDPNRPAATPDNLRGWECKEEDANFCMITDYRKKKGGKVWKNKARQIEETRYRKNTYTPYTVKVWIGDYVEEPAEPYKFYSEGMKQGEYNCFKRWTKLQTEPDKDLVLKMSMYPGDTVETKFKRLIKVLRDIPEDRVEQVVCHLTSSHEWEGESLV